MQFNLRMLNAWIGLCRGDPALPSDLRALGYEDRGIERKFRTAAGDEVVPELIIASDAEGHVVMLEWKSGGNLDSDQLDRYARVTGQDLVQRAYQSPAAAAAHDFAVVGDEAFEVELTGQLAAAPHTAPLLFGTATGIRLAANDFARQPITDVFTPELGIDWASAPTAFVPVDAESENWEVAEITMPMVIAQMAQRSPELTVAQLSQDICSLTWGSMGAPGQQAVRAKVRAVLEDAAAREFSSWLEIRGQAQSHATVLIRNNPFGEDPRDRAAALQRLRRQQTTLLERLKQGQLTFDI